MRKGKAIAQGAHASLQSLLSNAVKIHSALSRYIIGHSISGDISTIASINKYYAVPFLPDVEEWFADGCTKICVSVDSATDLVNIYEQAYNSGLRCALIQDKGLTEFKEPTYTAVGIGPNLSEEIDKITSELLLL